MKPTIHYKLCGNSAVLCGTRRKQGSVCVSAILSLVTCKTCLKRLGAEAGRPIRSAR